MWTDYDIFPIHTSTHPCGAFLWNENKVTYSIKKEPLLQTSNVIHNKSSCCYLFSLSVDHTDGLNGDDPAPDYLNLVELPCQEGDQVIIPAFCIDIFQ